MTSGVKFPLLLVHGVFFRDFDHFNYWGRIPEELIKNGATIYYGEHNSAAAVKDSALELEKRIKEIVAQTGCGKVNIIAHSKGGLDSRAAIAMTSAGQFPLNFTYHLVKYFDGANDGLVGVDSFKWGSALKMVRLEKKGRGISHGDMIDLNRENLKGLDVREFYVQLVSDLREKGF